MLESDKLSSTPEEEPEKNLADTGVVEKKENKQDFAKVQEAVEEQASVIKQELKEKIFNQISSLSKMP